MLRWSSESNLRNAHLARRPNSFSHEWRLASGFVDYSSEQIIGITTEMDSGGDHGQHRDA